MAQAPDAGATAFARLCQHWNAAATHGIQGFHGLSLLGSGALVCFFCLGLLWQHISKGRVVARIALFRATNHDLPLITPLPSSTYVMQAQI